MVNDDAIQKALAGLSDWIDKQDATLGDGMRHMAVFERDLQTNAMHVRIWVRDAKGVPQRMVKDLPLSAITANDIKTLFNAATDKE